MKENIFRLFHHYAQISILAINCTDMEMILPVEYLMALMYKLDAIR